jgi:hypothetical protein
MYRLLEGFFNVRPVQAMGGWRGSVSPRESVRSVVSKLRNLTDLFWGRSQSSHRILPSSHVNQSHLQTQLRWAELKLVVFERSHCDRSQSAKPLTYRNGNDCRRINAQFWITCLGGDLAKDKLVENQQQHHRTIIYSYDFEWHESLQALF